MKKKKLLLVAAGVVVAVLVCLAAVLMLRGIAALKTTQKNLEDAELELRRYYAKDPFPSTQNVERVKANVETLGVWQGKLMEKLMAGQVMPDATRSPSAFISLLEQKRLGLLGIGGEAVEKTFAFGFDRYFAADGVRPVPPHVPRLTQQLLIISDVCKVLFESDIIKLKGVRREQFEGGGGSKAVAAPDAGILKEDDLFTPLHFQFVFETKEVALLNVLNHLTRHTMFISVSNMKIERSVPDVVIPAVEEDEEGAEGEEEAEEPPAADAADAQPKELSREERIVCGPQMQQPVAVTLELDVYRFRQVEQEPEQEPEQRPEQE